MRLEGLWKWWREPPLQRGPATIYPVSVPARPVYATELPPGGGVEDFDKPEAVALNRARIDHLRRLGLSLQGKPVLEVGCGVGHLAHRLAGEGCKVLACDARPANIDRLCELYPGLSATVFNLEADDPACLGRFDVVLAYGLLYHLENPFRAVQRLAALCEELTLALRCAGFANVYAPRVAPDHPDFRFRWRSDLSTQRDGHLIRCVFVASRRPLSNPSLADLLGSGARVSPP